MRYSVATFRDPEFGISHHIANIILTVMQFDPEYGSAMNIRYSKKNLAHLKEKGFLGAHFDRRLEPRRIKKREGFSLEWGVGEVLKRMRRVPDFIYDLGDVGKEPMIRLLAKNPQEVVNKILKAFGQRQKATSKMGRE